MIDPDISLISSILEVKASGMIQDPQLDLDLPDGKSIAELLNDQENK